MATCENCQREVTPIEAIAVRKADGLHYVCSDQCAGELLTAAQATVKLRPLEQVAASQADDPATKLTEEHTKKELLAMAKAAGLKADPQANKATLAEQILEERG